MTPARWRLAALLALGVQVAGLLGVAAFALWRGNLSEGAWFTATEAGLAALVLAWWTVVLGRFTAGQAVSPATARCGRCKSPFPGSRPCGWCCGS
jgi:hypothetical protein